MCLSVRFFLLLLFLVGGVFVCLWGFCCFCLVCIVFVCLFGLVFFLWFDLDWFGFVI